MARDAPPDPAADLLERYAHEVERWLPRRQREPVGRELRALLRESVAERSREGMAPEAAATAVLRELGRPAEVAEGYAGHRPLVSPGLTPVFVRLAGVAIGFLALLGLASLAWSARGAAAPAAAFVDGLPRLAVSLTSSAFEILGLLVLIFAAIEWLGRPGRSRRPFDPNALPPIEPPERVNRTALAVELAVVSLLVVWLHLFPDRVAIITSLEGGAWRSLPIVGNGFFRALPWLTGWWLVVLAARGALFVRGRWTPELRLADLAAELAGVVALGVLFLSDPLIAASPAALADAGVPPETVSRLVGDLLPLLDTLAHVGVLIAWAALGVGVARRLVALARGRD